MKITFLKWTGKQPVELENLIGADLRAADLIGADLRAADLIGADLIGADLIGADLGEQWILPGHARSDGYYFFLQQLTGESEPHVKAGCRYFTLPEAWAHWRATRCNTPLGEETFAILESMEKIARIRGYIKSDAPELGSYEKLKPIGEEWK